MGGARRGRSETLARRGGPSTCSCLTNTVTTTRALHPHRGVGSPSLQEGATTASGGRGAGRGPLRGLEGHPSTVTRPLACRQQRPQGGETHLRTMPLRPPPAEISSTPGATEAASRRPRLRPLAEAMRGPGALAVAKRKRERQEGMLGG